MSRVGLPGVKRDDNNCVLFRCLIFCIIIFFLASLVVIGGRDENGESQNTVDVYNLDNGDIKWSHQAKPAPVRWTRAGTAVLNGNIYILDGYTRYSGQSQSEYKVRQFNFHMYVWTPLPNLPYAASHGPVVFTYMNTLFACDGGTSNSTQCLSLDLSNANPVWRQAPALPYKTHSPNIGVTIGNRTYICGGAERYLDKVISWDPGIENSWVEMEPMNVKRVHHCVVSDGIDTIYAISGCGDCWGDGGFVEKYNVVTGIWTIIKSTTKPGLRVGLHDIRTVICGYWSGFAYVVFSEHWDSGLDPRFHIFDTQQETWRTSFSEVRVAAYDPAFEVVPP